MKMQGFARAAIAATLMFGLSTADADAPAPKALGNPIMFVTQFPIPGDFASIGSVFANHRGDIDTVGRGGDLYIRYPNGTLRNLTEEAHYGHPGLQDATSIAVRDPALHWNGTKAVFSMVIGAPADQYQQGEWYWQLYEITGFGVGQTVSITRVPNQPANYNNVQPTYASDGSIIFGSDRPRNGQRHLYPQHDEYESTATNTGLWKLNPATGALTLLQHAPSGSFDPIVDSFGRVVFTRWDHLQRDQQADGGTHNNFNWASEAENAATSAPTEVFPEPRSDVAGVSYAFTINQFFPWQIEQDGRSEETLDHIGRHELSGYFNRSLIGDADLHEFISAGSGRLNPNDTENWLQIAEDPTHAGRYIAISAPEFYTHAAGQIVAMNAPRGMNPKLTNVQYLTPRSTRDFYTGAPPADFTGHYRNPLPMADGQLVAAVASESRDAGNDGTRENPIPRYKFRLQRLAQSGGMYAPAEALTPGIVKTISYYDPDVLVSYTGPLWELSPVEVRARTAPAAVSTPLAAPEQQAFALENVDPAQFSDFLRRQGLAVLVSRNVTTRDDADRQQPYNLRVPGGVQTVGNGGHVYDISYLQFLQADQIRGIDGHIVNGVFQYRAGRRVLAQPLHDVDALRFMPPPNGTPANWVPIAPDGSTAIIVPAQRALTWQSASAAGTPVVRERYWISAQPGEVRACDGCHGTNQLNQAGQPAAQNVPIALRNLLAYWRDHDDSIFKNGYEP